MQLFGYQFPVDEQPFQPFQLLIVEHVKQQ
jgi:hypothetical protein